MASRYAFMSLCLCSLSAPSYDSLFALVALIVLLVLLGLMDVVVICFVM